MIHHHNPDGEYTHSVNPMDPHPVEKPIEFIPPAPPSHEFMNFIDQIEAELCHKIGIPGRADLPVGQLNVTAPKVAETHLPLATQSPFLSGLHAIDRLNSWRRSKPSGHFISGSRTILKPIIYWVKKHAILHAARQIPGVKFQRLKVKVKCQHCHKGDYYPDWFDEEHHKPLVCNRCDGQGNATLRFIGTTIGDIKWHTPLHEFESSSLDHYIPFPVRYPGTFEILADDLWTADAGWAPHKPGRDLSLSDVERDLHLMRRAFTKDTDFIYKFHHRPHVSHRKEFTVAEFTSFVLQALYGQDAIFLNRNLSHPPINYEIS